MAADGPVVDGWAGLHLGTRDRRPVPECSRPGLVTAAGFSGTGLMHASAVDGVVRDRASNGRTELIDIRTLA